MKEEIVLSTDGYELSIRIYNVSNPKAIIQIAHGMEENQKRYEEFSKFLQSNGFCVISADMRGHGNNCQELGFFKEKNGYKYLIDDQLAIRNYIATNYKDVPCYLFAHSMGTIISRVFLQAHSAKYDKVVLCGYPCYNKAAPIGVLLSNIIILFKGPKFKSKLLQSLSTGSFNKKINSPKTPFDWISYNEDNVNAFKNDDLCGFGFTSSAYKDLLKLLILMNKPKKYQSINSNLKFLLIRGLDDPCIGNDKGASNSYNTLLKAGFRDIKRIDYPLMRHEILNEKKHILVFYDVLSFFNE